MLQLKKIKYLYTALACCLVALGLFFMIHPGVALETAYMLCGIVAIMLGAVKIMGYFSKDLFQLAFQFDLAIGIICEIIGICLLIQPKRIMEIVTVCIGVIVLIDALLRIQTAIDAKRFGLPRWWTLLLISLTAAVIGVLLLLMPYKSATFIMKLVGLNLFINGILNLVMVQSTVKTKREEKQWEI